MIKYILIYLAIGVTHSTIALFTNGSYKHFIEALGTVGTFKVWLQTVIVWPIAVADVINKLINKHL